MKPFEESLGSSPTLVGGQGKADAATLAEGAVLGNYRIIRLLGAGGMGAVYLVEHIALGTRHALKTIRAEFARKPGFEKRFMREAKLAARLKHPHIVACTDTGVADGIPFLVMDYIEGPHGEPLNLRQLLDQRRERGELLEEDEAAAVGLEICKALEYAHSYRDTEITSGIIHRDLKPANILLDKDTKLYIADFGLARTLGEKFEESVIQAHALSRSLGEDATLKGQAVASTDTVGTFDYMSPEQREGRVADARSDVYAMGVILYELLTGRKVIGVIKPPSKVRPGLDPMWDEIILSRCLAYDPEERYASAGAMCRAIEGVRSQRPEKPDSLVSSPWKAEPPPGPKQVVAPRLTHLDAEQPTRRRTLFGVVGVGLLAVAGIVTAVKLLGPRSEQQAGAQTPPLPPVALATTAIPSNVQTREIPVEPMGTKKVEADVQVALLDTPRNVVVGWDTELKAVIDGHAAGQPVRVQLYENGGLLMEVSTQLVGRCEMAFLLSHPKVGTFNYEVRLPHLNGETLTNDNTQQITVRVNDATNRVLYLEDVPRWESKYLLRLLNQSTNVSSSSYVRVGKRWVAFGGAQTNTMDWTQLPLSTFKLIILGDLEENMLPQAQYDALVQYVEAGGSLVLMGGERAWGAKGFDASSMKKLIPISRTDHRPLLEGKFNTTITPIGLEHPAFKPQAEGAFVMPPVLSIYPGSKPTAGAQVLVTVQTPEGTLPLVVEQRYGQGRVMVVLSDSLWRWQLDPNPILSKAYGRFWSQLIQALILKQTDTKMVAFQPTVSSGKVKQKAGDIGDVLKPIPASLTVNSIPEQARIYVNNQFRGEAPVVLTNLPPGEYSLRAEKRSFKADARNITLKHGDQVTEEFRLTRNSGGLIIVTAPAGAKVFVDDEEVGTTEPSGANPQVSDPLRVSFIGRGDHWLKLVKPGYSHTPVKITMDSDYLVTRTEYMRRLFIPDTIIRTGPNPEDSYTGVLLRRFPNGSVELELRPGISKTFGPSVIRSIGPINKGE